MTPQSLDQRTPPRDGHLSIKHNLSPSRKRELAIKRHQWKIEQEKLRRYEQHRKEYIEKWERRRMSRRERQDRPPRRSSHSRDGRSRSRSRSPEPQPSTSEETRPRETVPDPLDLKKKLNTFVGAVKEIADIISQTQQGLGSSTALVPPSTTEHRDPSRSTSQHKKRHKQSTTQDEREAGPSRPRTRSRSSRRSRSPCRRCGHRYHCTCTERCRRCNHFHCTCGERREDDTNPSPERRRTDSGRSQPPPQRRPTPPRTSDVRGVRSGDEAVRSRPEPSAQVASTSRSTVQAAPMPRQSDDIPRPQIPGVEWPPNPVTIMLRDQMIVTEGGGRLHFWLLAYNAGEFVGPPPIDIPFLRNGWCMPQGNLATRLDDERSIWVPLPLRNRHPYFPNQRGGRPPRPPRSNWKG